MEKLTIYSYVWSFSRKVRSYRHRTADLNWQYLCVQFEAVYATDERFESRRYILDLLSNKIEPVYLQNLGEREFPRLDEVIDECIETVEWRSHQRPWMSCLDLSWLRVHLTSEHILDSLVGPLGNREFYKIGQIRQVWTRWQRKINSTTVIDPKTKKLGTLEDTFSYD